MATIRTTAGPATNKELCVVLEQMAKTEPVGWYSMVPVEDNDPGRARLMLAVGGREKRSKRYSGKLSAGTCETLGASCHPSVIPSAISRPQSGSVAGSMQEEIEVPGLRLREVELRRSQGKGCRDYCPDKVGRRARCLEVSCPEASSVYASRGNRDESLSSSKLGRN